MTKVSAPANALIPTSTDDANRQQLAQKFFYLLGDVLAGVDSQPRFEPGMQRSDGLIGPAGGGWDFGIGQGGELFLRGQAGQVGTTSTTDTPTSSGITISPLILIVIVVGGWWLLKKR